jgi:hypothetical protein
MLDTTIHKTQNGDKQNKIHKHILCCVFCFVCLRLVSCVWWCLTHKVVCILFCLSSSCVLCMVVSNIYSPCTRHKTKTNKTKYTTQYLLDTTIHKTQDEDKQNKIHNTIYVRHHHTRVVYFVLFVFVLCLVCGGV